MTIENQNLPKLSIIIPAFVRSHEAMKRLEKAINSVVAQAQDCEILIIDDASPEPIKLPPNLCGQVPNRLIRHDVNSGAGMARNTGLQCAKAALVSFLDYDDVLLPNTLQKRLQYALGEGVFPSIEQEPHYIQGCGWQEVNDRDELRKIRHPAPTKDIADFCRGCWFCPGSTIIANRDFLLHGVGGFNKDYRRLEDADLFLRAGLKGAQFRPVPILGASILHHRNKSPDEIYQAAQLMQSQYLSDQAASPSLSLRQRQLLRAYLATEKANASLIEKNYVNLTIFAVQYFLNFPRLSPRWTEI